MCRVVWSLLWCRLLSFCVRCKYLRGILSYVSWSSQSRLLHLLQQLLQVCTVQLQYHIVMQGVSVLTPATCRRSGGCCCSAPPASATLRNTGISVHSCAIDIERWAGIARPPEVHNHLPGFLDVRNKIILLAPHSQLVYFLSVCWLVPVGDEAHHCCIICRFTVRLLPWWTLQSNVSCLWSSVLSVVRMWSY